MAAEIPAHFTGYGAENEAAGKAFDLTKIECRSSLRVEEGGSVPLGVPATD